VARLTRLKAWPCSWCKASSSCARSDLLMRLLSERESTHFAAWRRWAAALLTRRSATIAAGLWTKVVVARRGWAAVAVARRGRAAVAAASQRRATAVVARRRSTSIIDVPIVPSLLPVWPRAVVAVVALLGVAGHSLALGRHREITEQRLVALVSHRTAGARPPGEV